MWEICLNFGLNASPLTKFYQSFPLWEMLPKYLVSIKANFAPKGFPQAIFQIPKQLILL